MKSTKWWSTIAAVVLVATWGCDDEGSGNDNSHVYVASGGSASGSGGVGGSASGGYGAGAGPSSEGSLPDGVLSTRTCTQGVSFIADFSLPWEEAQERSVRACRNGGAACYEGTPLPDGTVSFPEVPNYNSGPAVRVTAPEQRLDFTWQDFDFIQELADGDRYTLTFEGEAHGSLVVIDETVTYSWQPILGGPCQASMCRRADVDLRGSDPNGGGGGGVAGGAGSAAGAAEGGAGGGQ